VKQLNSGTNALTLTDRLWS